VNVMEHQKHSRHRQQEDRERALDGAERILHAGMDAFYPGRNIRAAVE
jgi:hypothetical protein